MELTIQDIKEKQIPKAAFLLKETFTDDKGMRALLSEKDQANPKKLHEWFKATLKMQLQNNQLVWGAFHQKRLVGLAVASHSSFNPSFQSLISWTFAVGRSCGLKTVIRTISHDQARQKEFTKKNQLILEFIAVDPSYHKKGVGGFLLEKLQIHSRSLDQTVWLETTKPINTKIFAKKGFHLIGKKSEFEVEYYLMSNEAES